MDALVIGSAGVPVGVVVALVALAIYGVVQHDRNVRRKAAATRLLRARPAMRDAADALESGDCATIEASLSGLNDARREIEAVLTDPDTGPVVDHAEEAVYLAELDALIERLERAASH